ncbi:hypothetical protein ONE63_001746 [Megalurothrips usitatus]|uniref:Uncharacterized protein n=1 Tax=Megalurothrips usitatus TaxID=439358 RepID=A0AAV7XDG2_9NEOP|nr:hypothetical protein ONE63_001746 [Megalurothrips usitatus]
MFSLDGYGALGDSCSSHGEDLWLDDDSSSHSEDAFSDQQRRQRGCGPPAQLLAAGVAAAGRQPARAPAHAEHQLGLRGPARPHPHPAVRKAALQGGHAQAGHRLHRLPRRPGAGAGPCRWPGRRPGGQGHQAGAAPAAQGHPPHLARIRAHGALAVLVHGQEDVHQRRHVRQGVDAAGPPRRRRPRGSRGARRTRRCRLAPAPPAPRPGPLRAGLRVADREAGGSPTAANTMTTDLGAPGAPTAIERQRLAPPLATPRPAYAPPTGGGPGVVCHGHTLMGCGLGPTAHWFSCGTTDKPPYFCF